MTYCAAEVSVTIADLTRVVGVSCVAILMIVGATFAQAPAPANVEGEWEVIFVTPSGPNSEFTMFVSQSGRSLTGRLTSQSGEFPLKGTIDGDQLQIAWSFPDSGKMLDITFKARAYGDSMRGTVTLGNLGEGPMSADRTGR